MYPEEIFLMVASFLAVMTFCILESIQMKRKEAEQTPIFRDDYQEYETAELLARIWNDYEAVDICWACGRDDTPCIRLRDWLDAPGAGLRSVCKWCQELKNITYHLEQNGERRKKEMRRVP